MNKILLISLMQVFLVPLSLLGSNDMDSLSISEFIIQFESAEKTIKNLNQTNSERCQKKLFAIEQQLRSISLENDLEAAVALLISKGQLQAELAQLENDGQVKLAKLRYRKGIELTRLLYEKILGLDHHFSSMQTTHEIVKLSNPQNYPDFQRFNDLLDAKMKKQTGVKMPALMQENPMVAASFALIGTMFSEGDSKIKEKDLESMACLIDFTLRMNNDLNLIYYETDYLKESNKSLKEECIELFDEYVKVIGYQVPLDKCREQDDWETLFGKLDDYMAAMEKLYAGTPDEVSKAYKKHASLEFPVNLLTEFINKYNNFIGQGEQYYHKFEVILGNYQNEAVCAKNLPEKFQSLKTEMKASIVKFDEAYNIAELRGSKLKDLLYGWSE
jgi:hypothetical protein